MELFSLFSALCVGIGAIVLLCFLIIALSICVGGLVGMVGAWRGKPIVSLEVSDSKKKKKEVA